MTRALLHPAQLIRRTIVIHDELQVELGWGFGIDLFEEANALLMPMARYAVADHCSVQHAEGRTQRRRAVACVVVCHGLAAALLQREARLGAVESLGVASLVDAQNQGPAQRIEVQPNDIVNSSCHRNRFVCSRSMNYPAARTGRNPRTGEVLKIKAGRVPRFRAGKALKEAVNKESHWSSVRRAAASQCSDV